jgi:hypothetical protein
MTIAELQALFQTQTDTGAVNLYYQLQQPGVGNNAITISVMVHNIDTGTWQDLLDSLQGFVYTRQAGPANWPIFIKDNT